MSKPVLLLGHDGSGWCAWLCQLSQGGWLAWWMAVSSGGYTRDEALAECRQWMARIGFVVGEYSARDATYDEVQTMIGGRT